MGDGVEEAAPRRPFHLLEVGPVDLHQVPPGVLLLVVGVVQGPGAQVVDASQHVVKGVASDHLGHEGLGAGVVVGLEADAHVEVRVPLPHPFQGQEVEGKLAKAHPAPRVVPGGHGAVVGEDQAL